KETIATINNGTPIKINIVENPDMGFPGSSPSSRNTANAGSKKNKT
ncbi:MAG: hypothetical protein RLZZ37_984, partial [Actinomycetota bacterium]